MLYYHLLWNKLLEISSSMLCCGRKKGRTESSRPPLNRGIPRGQPRYGSSDGLREKEAPMAQGSGRTTGSRDKRGLHDQTPGLRSEHGKLRSSSGGEAAEAAARSTAASLAAEAKSVVHARTGSGDTPSRHHHHHSSSNRSSSANNPHSRHSPHSSPQRKLHHSRSKSNTETLEMGIKNVEIIDDDTVIQTVEILKNPGQTLGFYIREGNGMDRNEGVFISRIAQGSVVENNGLLRVGDEIVTVNSVDVTRTSLDDVVILMSIPKRLVLTIRTKRNYSKNASCPSLCTIEQEEKPIVVLKKGRSSSATAVEMTEKCPDEFILTGQDARGYYDVNTTSRHSNYAKVEDLRRAGTPKPKGVAPPIPQGPSYKLPVPGDRLYQAADDSGDSGLSSENSGYSAKGGEGSSSQSQTSTTHHGSYPQIGIIERAVDDLSSLPLDSHTLQMGDGRSPRLSPRDPMVHFHSPKSGRRGLPGSHMLYPVDYSSDSEAIRGETYITRGYPPRQYDQNAVRQFQEEIERTHGNYEGYVTAKHKFNKSRSLSPGPESYNSDSEVVYATHGVPAVPMRPQGSAHQGPRPQMVSRLLDMEDRCNSLPRMDSGEPNPEEISHWLRKFDTWSTELQGQEEYSSSLPTSTSEHLEMRPPDPTNFSHYRSDQPLLGQQQQPPQSFFSLLSPAPT